MSSIPRLRAALAVLFAALAVAACQLDTSTPSGWQSRGPRSSAELPAATSVATSVAQD